MQLSLKRETHVGVFLWQKFGPTRVYPVSQPLELDTVPSNPTENSLSPKSRSLYISKTFPVCDKENPVAINPGLVFALLLKTPWTVLFTLPVNSKLTGIANLSITVPVRVMLKAVCPSA